MPLRYHVRTACRINLLFYIVGIIIAASSHASQSYRLADYPLFAAAYDGNAAKVDQLIKNGENVDQQVGENTPLTYAIDWQKIEVVKTLLAHGADPNRQIQGKTPLIHVLKHWSMRPNTEPDEAVRMQMLRLLLKAGADPNPSNVQRSPLSTALWTRQMRLFQQLKEAGAKFNTAGYDAPLIEAVRYDRFDIIGDIFKSGVGPDDMHDGQGCTALCEAVRSGKTEAVRILLKAKAKWDIETKPSSTYNLTWAAWIATSKSDILRQFLDAGLSANTLASDRYSHKTSLLHMAAKNGEMQSIDLLLKHRAKIDFPDGEGYTPLMLAARNGKIENMKTLLAAKANFSLMNNWGKTAKILATESGKNAAAQLLADAGADEYAGSTIPFPSRYAAELIGRQQTDVSGHIYQALPFLPKSLRFFVAHDQLHPEHDSLFPTDLHGKLYAVFPSRDVEKLDKPSSFLSLKFKLNHPQDALKLARMFSDPDRAVGWGVMRMDGVEFTEFPEPNNCLSITPPPSTFGITPPIASEQGAGAQRIYRVTRFGILRSQNKKSGNEMGGYGAEPPKVVNSTVQGLVSTRPEEIF